MINKKIDVKSLNTNKELLDVINFLKTTYGQLIALGVVAQNNNVMGYYTPDQIDESIEIDYSKVGNIRFTLLGINQEIVSAVYDNNEKSINVTILNMDNTISPVKEAKPRVALNALDYIDDKDCCYYNFENGKIAKYNPMFMKLIKVGLLILNQVDGCMITIFIMKRFILQGGGKNNDLYTTNKKSN